MNKKLVKGLLITGGIVATTGALTALNQPITALACDSDSIEEECYIPDCYHWTGTIGAKGGLNLRVSPSENSGIKQVIPTGTKVVILEESNSNWFKVRLDNGSTGFVSKKYIYGTSMEHTLNHTNTNNFPRPGDYQDLTFRKGTVTVSSSLRVRKGPSINDTIVGYLPAKTIVSVGGKIGDFYYVEANGIKGYASADYISLGETESNSLNSTNVRTGVVFNIKTNLRVRSEANTSSPTIAYLLNSQKVEILGEQDGFYKIKLPNNKIGFSSKNYIK